MQIRGFPIFYGMMFDTLVAYYTTESSMYYKSTPPLLKSAKWASNFHFGYKKMVLFDNENIG